MTVIVRPEFPEEKEWITWQDTQQKAFSTNIITATDKSETIFTALNGVYMALLAFFGLSSNSVLTNFKPPVVFLFLIPPVFWLIGMYCFMQVKKPYIAKQRPNDASAIRRDLYKSNIIKANSYIWGITFFSIGVLSIIFAVVGGLYFTSIPVQPTTFTESNIQLVFMDDQASWLSQIPMEFVPGTNTTTNVTLVNMTETGYRVMLANGDSVDVQKAWVKTVIWKPKPPEPALQPG